MPIHDLNLEENNNSENSKNTSEPPITTFVNARVNKITFSYPIEPVEPNNNNNEQPSYNILRLIVDNDTNSINYVQPNNKVILLNFEEDDMFRPVIQMDDKYIDIIKKIYEDSEILLDIETLNIDVPNSVPIKEVQNELFNDLNYKHKEEFVNSYLPSLFSSLILKNSLNAMKQKYFNQTRDVLTNKSLNTSHYSLTSLGINIPEIFSESIVMPKQKNLFPYEIFNNDNIVNDLPEGEKLLAAYDSWKYGQQSSCVDMFSKKNLDKKINTTPVPYNDEQNSLFPSFSSNCENLETNNLANEKHIVVLIHNVFLKTIVIENPDIDFFYVIENHTEYGFTKLFEHKTSSEDAINIIKSYFNNYAYNDVDEINKQLDIVSQHIELTNKQTKLNVDALKEERMVRCYLGYKYVINNNINHKMKASVLCDDIINSGYVTITNLPNFKTRLSKYLKNLGLQKKRYNDGYYYYGIILIKKKEQYPNIHGAFEEEKLRREIDAEIKYRFDGKSTSSPDKTKENLSKLKIPIVKDNKTKEEIKDEINKKLENELMEREENLSKKYMVSKIFGKTKDEIKDETTKKPKNELVDHEEKLRFVKIAKVLRNSNVQLRPEPANPKLIVGPWNASTIKPEDSNNRQLDYRNRDSDSDCNSDCANSYI